MKLWSQMKPWQELYMICGLIFMALASGVLVGYLATGNPIPVAVVSGVFSLLCLIVAALKDER